MGREQDEIGDGDHAVVIHVALGIIAGLVEVGGKGDESAMETEPS